MDDSERIRELEIKLVEADIKIAKLQAIIDHYKSVIGLTVAKLQQALKGGEIRP